MCQIIKFHCDDRCIRILNFYFTNSILYLVKNKNKCKWNVKSFYKEYYA